MQNWFFLIQSIIFIGFSTVDSSVWNNYFAVPGELLNRRDLDALGLHRYTESAQQLDVSSLGRIFQLNIATPDSSILVPSNTSLLFLFNSTSHGIPWDLSDNDGYMSEQFVQTSLPVGLPQYHYIVNLFLMVPFLHSEGTMEKFPFVRSDVYMSRIGFPYQQTPLTDKMIRNKSCPLMVFTFHSGDDARNFLGSNDGIYEMIDNSSYTTAKKKVSDALLLSSSEVAKAVIATSDNFFDNFARVWVQALGVDTLFYSLFCQINVNIQELSYCLRFINSGAEISVLTKDQYFNASVPLEFEMSVDRRNYWPATNPLDIIQRSRRLRKLFSTFADSLDKSRDEQETLRNLLSTSLATNLPKITRYVYTLSLKWIGTEVKEVTDGPTSFFKRTVRKSIQWRPLLRNNISPKQVSNSDQNCTVITWKKVFLHSLFGENMNFCTIEAADEKKKSMEKEKENSEKEKEEHEMEEKSELSEKAPEQKKQQKEKSEKTEENETKSSDSVEFTRNNRKSSQTESIDKKQSNNLIYW